MKPGALLSPTARVIAPPDLAVTDRAAWLELRRGGIGGSDAAAVLGLDDYATRWQVWVDKTLDSYDGDAEFTEEQREWLAWGNEMEAVMCRIWGRRAGLRPQQIQRAGMLQHTAHPWLRVNLDRRVVGCPENDGPCIIECKNRSAYAAKHYGADADEVPDGPAIQAQHGLLITGYTHAHLLVAIGGNQLRHYLVPADTALQATMLEELGYFWHTYVVPRKAPPIDAAERTGRILARLWDAEEGKVAKATAGQLAAVEELRAACAVVAAAEEQRDRLKHELQEQMADAEVLLHPEDDYPVLTWIPNGTFASDRFRADRPDLAALYATDRPAIDTKALAKADPELYRSYRGRRFTIKTPPKRTA